MPCRRRTRKAAAAAQRAKNRDPLPRRARWGVARQRMPMLQLQGGVQEAAGAAAGGDPSQLMSMMSRLMNTKEGAELVERIGSQAKRAGLE